MGKNVIYSYSCDKCSKIFKSPKEVMRLDTQLLDGENEMLYDEQEWDKFFCKDCFINRLFGVSKTIVCENKIIETDQVEINETPVIEYSTLLKINSEKDELTFINFLGHLSKESFNKLYNKSLIGVYFTVEGCVDVNLNECYSGEIKIIDKMIAGIPQIKTVNAYINDENNIALVSKSLLSE